MQDHQANLANQEALANLAKRFSNGANWFYWVAGLSLVNTLLGIFGSDWAFIFGLGATQVVEAVALAMADEMPDSAGVPKTGAVVISFLILGMVVVVGWLSNKGITPVFVIGIALYILDGLLFLLAQDWLSIAFHAFAAWQMISGVQALRQLKRLAVQVATLQAQEGEAVMPPVTPEG